MTTPGMTTPGMTTLELTFQAALFDALNAPGRPTRVHRQNVGTVVRRDARGRKQGIFHAGPPTGAADLAGLVAPDGLHLEVECKSASAPWTPAQHRWCDFIRARGGVYVLVRYDERYPLEVNVDVAVADIDAAIAERRGTPCTAVHPRTRGAA
jgi:hypothetical protein